MNQSRATFSKKAQPFFSLLLAVITLVFSNDASALLVAQKPAGAEPMTWNRERKTHIIFASKGLMFSAVGYQQAQVFAKLYPQDQILFISNLPSSENYKTTKQKQLKKQGFQIVDENSMLITSEVFISTILRHTNHIQTLSIIGHNGVDKGPWLEDGDNRLDFKNDKLMGQLKSAFSPDGWVRLQGCNSGWNVARYLGQSWNVPVIASFTSTSFYYLNQNGQYEIFKSIEKEDTTTPAITPAAVDQWSFADATRGADPVPCLNNLCLTLIPEAGPYHFQNHRSPEAAWLSMMKPVCAASISDERCQIALAESLIAGVGSVSKPQAIKDVDTYKLIVFQSICGSHSTGRSQKICIENIEKTYAQRVNYLPYKNGTLLKCEGLRACRFEQVSIDLRKNKGGEQHTILEYIDHALAGYRLLIQR